MHRSGLNRPPVTYRCSKLEETPRPSRERPGEVLASGCRHRATGGARRTRHTFHGAGNVKPGIARHHTTGEPNKVTVVAGQSAGPSELCAPVGRGSTSEGSGDLDEFLDGTFVLEGETRVGVVRSRAELLRAEPVVVPGDIAEGAHHTSGHRE